MVKLEPIDERRQLANRESTHGFRKSQPNINHHRSRNSNYNNKRSYMHGKQFNNNMNSGISNTHSASRPTHERPYDIIIFGASGSVGQFLVEELALVVGKQYSTSPPPSFNKQSPSSDFVTRRQSVPSSKQKDITWAIAGRSAVRLNETLGKAELSTGIRNLSREVPVILADLNKHDSLVNLCNQTRLVINCIGPYSEYGGELLIKAALVSKTNYIDLSHETNFNDYIRQKYSSPAREVGIYIIQGCGFQSMSSELGLNFTKNIADGQVEQVKIILDLNDSKAAAYSSNYHDSLSPGIISPGMWQSLLADKAALEYPSDRNVSDHLVALNNNNPKHHIKRQGSSNKLDSIDEDDNRNHDEKTPRRLERKDTQTLVKDIIQFRNRNSLSFWWPPIRLIQNSLIRVFSIIIPSSSQALAASDNLISAASKQTRTSYTWPIDSITSDESQLIRSEMMNYELRKPDSQQGGWRPVQCSNFITLRSFTELCSFCIWLFIFQVLAKFSLTRRLLRIFPRLSTANFVHPSPNSTGALASGSTSASSSSLMKLMNNHQISVDRASLSHIKFSQTFLAYGTPNDNCGDPLEFREKNRKRKQTQLLVSRIVGPEPNHVATATYAIQAALTVLIERDLLPDGSSFDEDQHNDRSSTKFCGGVLTPGVAFAETNIIYQLKKRNIKFEVLKKA